MTAKLVKWASSDGSITKSWLSGRRNAVFLLPVVGFSYDGSRIEGHLGNVGYDCVEFEDYLGNVGLTF